MVRECPVLQPLRQQYAAQCSTNTATMKSFAAQQDHMRGFDFLWNCLDFLKISRYHLSSSSKYDQTCWLAKALSTLSQNAYTLAVQPKGLQNVSSCVKASVHKVLLPSHA